MAVAKDNILIVLFNQVLTTEVKKGKFDRFELHFHINMNMVQKKQLPKEFFQSLEENSVIRMPGVMEDYPKRVLLFELQLHELELVLTITIMEEKKIKKSALKKLILNDDDKEIFNILVPARRKIEHVVFKYNVSDIKLSDLPFQHSINMPNKLASSNSINVTQAGAHLVFADKDKKLFDVFIDTDPFEKKAKGTIGIKRVVNEGLTTSKLTRELKNFLLFLQEL